MRKCKINIGDKDYNLELNRKTVLWLENKGFALEKLEEKPITMYGLLFESAFIANYPNLNASEMMEKYEEEDGDSAEVVEFLIEEYTAFINALADTKSRKKKIEII